MNRYVRNKLPELVTLCEKYPVKSLHLFGSAITGDFNPESDIDFLVSFNDNLSFEEYTDSYFSLHESLQALFQRKIDLITQNSLSNPYFIDEVEQTKQLIYAA